MRPPLLSTPPVSHVISRKFKPTPAVTCIHDWRNLTSDTSIQIMSLESSAYHEESSMYDVSNHISFVDTIISPRADDISLPLTSSPHIDEACIAETLVSVDSLTHCQGSIFDARIIFTPKGRCSTTGSHCQARSHIPAKADTKFSPCQQRLTRNCNSDSNLNVQRKAVNKHTNRQAFVTRSMSLNHAEHTKRNNDTCLVKPLLPCANKSKIGNVKRIPSFRDSVRPVPVVSAKPVAGNVNTGINDETMNPTVSTGQKCKSHGLETVQKVGVPKSKIAKLVKVGLRSVVKSKSNSREKCAEPLVKDVTAFERRRQRKVRHSSDIGGLSEFLRKNERRRTVGVITEEKFDSAPKIDLTLSQTSSGVSRCEASEKCAPKPVMGSRRLHSTGTSNLKFNQCQRKLVFQSTRDSPKTNADFDPSKHAEKYISLENDGDSMPRRRPRLGVLASTKPVNIVPIDELEIDIVHDLKRRVERANRCSKIKTNGSLKMKSKVLPIDKPMVVSPRSKSMLCRHNRISTTYLNGRHLRLKRESVV
ncbi:uncharacterized protein LOC123528145 [Mercenaria mercenaria]|uniref:uncharacterized protein LOC123528145 n=1 Tax=Mercenaria mercenaria TaxID=6596 RepID=UPI00234F4FE5|nr:uncharacterized protein LOC123528145 [Mercenaria mercenaria]XP_045163824.2 uncharacterized protein LOC123528145 [Mercenaria mercenaria]